jgi:hypothetical protein
VPLAVTREFISFCFESWKSRRVERLRPSVAARRAVNVTRQVEARKAE